MSKVKIAGHASGSGTLTIQAPDTSSSRTITLPDSTDTLIGAATTDALTTRINATGGRKNMVINGAMQVSQRGTSFAAIGNGDYSLDRWGNSNANIGVYTVTQDSDAPDGFANSYKVDCTTADASPTGADYLFIFQKIEGQDLQCWKKGTASAESITLSFWVKSNKTGDIQTNLYDTDNTRIIGNTITINSAGTWEQKSLTFAGDTTGAFTNDTNDSLKIEWWLDAGSSYSSGSVPTSWEAVATGDRAAGTTLALADSTSNYLNITGVQLELGTAATEFEHRSYGEELALCQRYYQEHYVGIRGAKGNGTAMIGFSMDLPVAMRAAATVTVGAGSTCSVMLNDSTLGGFTISSITISKWDGNMTYVNFNISGSALTDNRGYILQSVTYLECDSEL